MKQIINLYDEGGKLVLKTTQKDINIYKKLVGLLQKVKKWMK